MIEEAVASFDAQHASWTAKLLTLRYCIRQPSVLRLCGAVDPYDGNGRHDGKRSHAARCDTPRGLAHSIPANAAMTKRIDLFLQYLPSCLNSRPARPARRHAQS